MKQTCKSWNTMTTNEKFLHHAPCEDCGSRDNLGIYENHTYCFGCHDYQKTTGVLPEQIQTKINTEMINGNYNRLDRRNIDEETCKVFDYQQGEYDGRPVQIDRKSTRLNSSH